MPIKFNWGWNHAVNRLRRAAFEQGIEDPVYWIHDGHEIGWVWCRDPLPFEEHITEWALVQKQRKLAEQKRVWRSQLEEDARRDAKKQKAIAYLAAVIDWESEEYPVKICCETIELDDGLVADWEKQSLAVLPTFISKALNSGITKFYGLEIPVDYRE